MKIIAVFAPISGLVAWVLIALTVANLLSGEMAQRSCQTECVSTMFFSGMAAATVAMVFSIVSFFSSQHQKLGIISLLIALPVFGVSGSTILIGNLA